MAAEETPQTPENKPAEPRAEAADNETTEGGFGTGLRAQLKRRREPNEEPEAARAEAPIVRVDLYATAPASISTSGDNGSHPDLEQLRGELSAALARELDLKQALAEQVEAYERKLSEDHVTARAAAELDDHARGLDKIEADMAQRERALAAERKALEEERKRVAQLEAELKQRA